MAQDIRKLFEEARNNTEDKMSSGHEARFLKKLDSQLPIKKSKSFNWLQIAASIVVIMGLGYGTFTYFNNPIEPVKVVDTNKNQEEPTKSLGDISPDLKKVEDYYLANINLELSKVKLTPDNKELIDGYISRLDELNKEYKRLSIELTESGANELTVNALITNLKFRLNLMYRLKEQLKLLNETNESQNPNKINA
ncbi:hypothetical protein [Hanstruepera marina]|uniref:hypothetical protein n=1 Tax=Hanstruepera marina TaxID=2873265 RepID=UPI001CA71557|nr:hypothetical protein [Hanstruepera marina]